MATKWSALEIDFLKTNFKEMTFKKMSTMPMFDGRSATAIKQRANKFGLKKNGFGTINNGYKLIVARDCPYVFKDGRVYEHIYQWWKHNPSDRILSTEVIHHIDGNRLNNYINNLRKMCRNDHIDLHRKQGDLRRY